MANIGGKDKSIVSILIGLLAIDGVYFATPLYNEDHGRAPMYALFYSTGAVVLFGIVLLLTAAALIYGTWRFDSDKGYKVFLYSMFVTFVCCCYMFVSLAIAPSPPGAVVIFPRYTLQILPIALSGVYWIWAKNFVKRPSG